MTASKINLSLDSDEKSQQIKEARLRVLTKRWNEIRQDSWNSLQRSERKSTILTKRNLLQMVCYQMWFNESLDWRNYPREVFFFNTIWDQEVSGWYQRGSRVRAPDPLFVFKIIQFSVISAQKIALPNKKLDSVWPKLFVTKHAYVGYS